jgi:hypothetical protein
MDFTYPILIIIFLFILYLTSWCIMRSKKKYFKPFDLDITITPHSLKNVSIDAKPKNIQAADIVIDDSDKAYYQDMIRQEQIKEARRLEYINDLQKTQIIDQLPFLLDFTHIPVNNITDNILDYDLGEDNFGNGGDVNHLNLLNFNGDSQNVHNSLVQDTIKNKYNKIKNPLNNSVKIDRISIIEMAKKCGKNDEIINSILNDIERRNSSVSNIDSTEVKVLNDSWLAANDDIKEQILNELLDARSTGILVCPTGVCSRIINADIVLDPESSPRTAETLRIEMLDTASKIRSDLEKDTNYLILSESEQTIMFKDALIDRYTENYKDIISASFIQKELDEWIEHV